MPAAPIKIKEIRVRRLPDLKSRGIPVVEHLAFWRITVFFDREGHEAPPPFVFEDRHDRLFAGTLPEKLQLKVRDHLSSILPNLEDQEIQWLQVLPEDEET